jgi:hypothetical protein
MPYKTARNQAVRDKREPIPGGTTFTPGKPIKVKIAKVESKDNRIIFTFEDSFGNIHRESLFRLTSNRTGISTMVREILAAIADKSLEILDWYDTILDGDLPDLIGRQCVIETEYRGDFVNLKEVSIDYSSPSRSNIQPSETNSSYSSRANNPETDGGYISLSDTAQAFLGSGS